MSMLLPSISSYRFSVTLGLTLLFIVSLAAEPAAAQRRSSRTDRKPSPARKSEPPPTIAQPPAEEEPADLAFRSLTRTNATRPSGRERSLAAPPALSTEQLNALAPQRRQRDPIVPPRGYPTSERPAVKDHPIYADGSFGMFATTRLDAGYSGTAWPFDFYGTLDLDLSDGHEANNPHRLIDVGLGAGYIIDEGYGLFSGGHMGAELDYSSRMYHLYAIPESPQRTATSWLIGTNGSNAVGGITYDGSARYRTLTMAEDTGSTRETSLDGSLTVTSLMDGFTLGASADARLTSLAGTSISFGRLHAFASYSNSFMTARAGLAFSAGGNTDMAATGAIAPTAELRLFPLTGVSVIATLSGGVLPTSLASLSAVNRYVQAAPEIRQQREKIGYQLNVRLEPSRSFSVRAGAGRSSYSDYSWFGSADRGMFAPHYDDAIVNRAAGDLYWSLDELDQIAASIQYTDARIGQRDTAAPYTAAWVADLSYSRGVRKLPLRIDGSIRYIGERPGPEGTRFAAVPLLNLAASYSLGSHFDVTAELKNILNRRYELWQGYAERGIFGAIGVRSRF